MAESLFDIFGHHVSRKATKNVSRQPLCNIENMGKTISAGPVKPNEPVKKHVDTKKSFLSNAGKGLQSTPVRQVFTPRAVNVGSLIYTEEKKPKTFEVFEDLEFTKPCLKYDDEPMDMFDFLRLPDPVVAKDESPPSTPPPIIKKSSAEFDCSYQDEFFHDEFSIGSLPDEDLGLPDLY